MTVLAGPSMIAGDLNATITNITASQQFALDGNFTQHQSWSVIVDGIQPMIIHDVDGNRTIGHGQRWWINVDAGTGDVVSIEYSL